MMEEIKNEVMEEVLETAMENVEVQAASVGKNFGKAGVIVGGVITLLGISAGALWKNRNKIVAKREEKLIAKLEKRGYIVTVPVDSHDGIRLATINEESE